MRTHNLRCDVVPVNSCPIDVGFCQRIDEYVHIQDNKDMAWARDYGAPTAEVADEDQKVGLDAVNEFDSDPDGWQQYRSWISKAPTPRGRRAGFDPSLYTWKGYRSWSEQVKRNWRET